MKKLKFTYNIFLIFPLFLFGQTESEIEKVPDFMISQISVVKKDTLQSICFCFDESDKQIYDENLNNLKNVKYCKVFEKKYIKGVGGYWIYEMFLDKDTVSKFVADYNNIDNANWLMKKYKNNVIISENKIKVTDSVVGTSTMYMGSMVLKKKKSIIRHYLKTEIVD
ncbi:MAG: hypothetical protein A3F91_10270 [Flavobacteria bacterium RIFCSPLOWO2_12_FULL_35_11]|nr:MAG: hypothetical protein A3F91_10270 [Flavobacteria bacterium RIFCSPLOWO2_12_FULL_35_11]